MTTQSAPTQDSAAQVHRIRVGLHCRAEADLAHLARLLGWFGDVRLVMDVDALAAPLGVDLLVAEVSGQETDGVSRLRACRAANPDVPLLILGRDVDANVALELVALVGDDLLVLPAPNGDAVFRKAERLLLGGGRPAVDAPCLWPLRPLGKDPEACRRRVTRAEVPQAWPTGATVEDLAGRPSLRVGDLSAPAEDGRGGVMLVADRPIARALVTDVPGFGPGAALNLNLWLHGEELPIAVKATVARLPKPVGADYPFGVQVDFASDADRTRFARFWTACRLQNRRDRGELVVRRGA